MIEWTNSSQFRYLWHSFGFMCMSISWVIIVVVNVGLNFEGLLGPMGVCHWCMNIETCEIAKMFLDCSQYVRCYPIGRIMICGDSLGNETIPGATWSVFWVYHSKVHNTKHKTDIDISTNTDLLLTIFGVLWKLSNIWLAIIVVAPHI